MGNKRIDYKEGIGMILGVIPARGGSKGIPRKNIKEICGKPLIAWSIEAAQKSLLLDDFIVSTEDDEIKKISSFYGAKVLDRPNHLASDEATTISVLQHIIKELNPDIIVVLQPTSPIRSNTLIDNCIEKFNKFNADNLATGYVCKFREFGSYDNLRRQDLKGFFYDDGNVYVLKRDLILSGKWSGNNIEKFFTKREENYEIDDHIDFFIVEKLLEKEIQNRLAPSIKKIKLLAMDIDGVFTDAGMYYSENGDELKKFNTRDGKGIELLKKAGIKTAIITQEETNIVQKRGKKLNVDYIFQNVKDKRNSVEELIQKEALKLDEIAYIGDDLNDNEILKIVGLSATPADGIIENKKVVKYICRNKGGEGCVREFCELILRNN